MEFPVRDSENSVRSTPPGRQNAKGIARVLALNLRNSSGQIPYSPPLSLRFHVCKTFQHRLQSRSHRVTFSTVQYSIKSIASLSLSLFQFAMPLSSHSSINTQQTNDVDLNLLFNHYLVQFTDLMPHWNSPFLRNACKFCPIESPDF